MINKINSNYINNLSTEHLSKKRVEDTQKSEKTSRVEEIKKSIENGSYKIDIDATAKALAKNLL